MDRGNFYATTSQVIPVLLLLLIFEQPKLLTRRIYRNQATSDVMFGTSVFVILLVLAEASALAGLLGISTWIQDALIITGIGASIHVMLTPILHDLRTGTDTEKGNDRNYYTRSGRIGYFVDYAALFLAKATPSAVTLAGVLFVLLHR